MTPPLPLNKVYYRPGSNPFKSPTRGDGPGLGEGSVIPMNLLQGDLDSAGRADGPGPGSGKQPFSLMIPNKDKRAERIGDRSRGPTARKSWSPGMLPCVSLLWTTGTVSTELQLHSFWPTFFPAASWPPHASSASPCLRRKQEPSQRWGCTSCMPRDASSPSKRQGETYNNN